jgi:hypothetical protein
VFIAVESDFGGSNPCDGSVDPALTSARLFMYFYLFINIGSLCGQIGMVYAEKVSFNLLIGYHESLN